LRVSPSRNGWGARLVLCLFALTFVGAPSDLSAAPAKKRVGQKTTTTRTTLKPGTSRTPRYSRRLSRARRAKLARVRAAAYARALREASLPQFKTDVDGQLIPDVRAEAAIVYDPESNEVLFEENSNDQRSIASITKVMTATVVLESDPDLSREVTVERADMRGASTTYLRANERIQLGALLNLLLVASDNAAARVLARTWPGGTEAFVGRMNEKAAELGLEHTHYAEPSGLMASNVSSAYDMARLIAFASADERIGPIMRTRETVVKTNRRTINIHSTNKLLTDFDVRGGKTGFIRNSGYCLATLLKLPQGRQIAVVVLGAGSSVTRFMETRHLVNWLSEKAKTLLGSAEGAPQEFEPQLQPPWLPATADGGLPQ
jgi:D-alanyl-D-alanine endopeptidase (penicillin-binding protein 7)